MEGLYLPLQEYKHTNDSCASGISNVSFFYLSVLLQWLVLTGKLLSRHPEDHVCQSVDEWSSGRDSAQTPPVCGVKGGTPAVKPGGSIHPHFHTISVISQ